MWSEEDYREISKKNPKHHYFRYKYWSAERGYEFILGEETFIKMIKKPCYYCGSTIGKFRGIDRINNSEGYLPENCVPCCTKCNRAKSMSTKRNFILWAKRIAKNFPDIE